MNIKEFYREIAKNAEKVRGLNDKRGFYSYMCDTGIILNILKISEVEDTNPGLIATFALIADNAYNYGFAQGQKAAADGYNMYLMDKNKNS